MAREDEGRGEQPSEEELQKRREALQRRMDSEAAAGFEVLYEPQNTERKKDEHE
ncbi:MULTISPECIES: hypothetical protein [unclassified Thioalkalivibrio]|uniref:hypothetical protein n=1 Tax=unclassified Thioalkalivibrio TaxID=2621013 RepID=UPI0003601CB8|nr:MULTISPECIES: hypothetical protein [unclassified Thioalkalivibrio]